MLTLIIGLFFNLFLIFSCSEGYRVGMLLAFVSEGDNALDAVQLASYVNLWKGWVNLKVC